MSYLGNGVGRQQVGAGQLGPAAVQYSNLDTSVTGPMSGYKNKIINGDFYYWQRGLSASTPGYACDRWRTFASGSTMVNSAQFFTNGQTAVPNEPQVFSRVVVTSVAGANNYVGFGQPIESVRTLAGQVVTLSFYAKADATRNVCVEIAQNFGTGGSPSAFVTNIAQTVPLTTAWQKFSVTTVLGSIAGKVVGSNADDSLNINFWYDAGSSFNSRLNNLGQQSGTFDIAQVQLEAGSVATQFEYRPRAVELMLCQRYFEIGDIPPLFIASLNAASMMFPFTYKVSKRATPSVTFSNIQYYNAGTPTAISSGYTVTGGGTNSSSLYISSGTTNMGGLAAGQYAASAEL